MKGRDGSMLRLYRCRGERSGGKCPARLPCSGTWSNPTSLRPSSRAWAACVQKGSVLTEELRAVEDAFARADREYVAWRDNESLSDLGANTYVEGLRVRTERREEALEQLDEARTRAGVAELPTGSNTREILAQPRCCGAPPSTPLRSRCRVCSPRPHVDRQALPSSFGGERVRPIFRGPAVALGCVPTPGTGERHARMAAAQDPFVGTGHGLSLQQAGRSRRLPQLRGTRSKRYIALSPIRSLG